MRIFKILILLICIFFALLGASTLTFCYLNPAQQNKIVKYSLNKILKSYYPNIKFEEVFVDVKNNSLILQNFETDLGNLSIKIPTLTANYDFGYIKNSFDISFPDVFINNTNIEHKFVALYSTDWALQNQLLTLKMLNAKQEENQCSVRMTHNQVSFDSCSFGPSDVGNIKINGSLQKDLSNIDIKATFASVPLESYKLLKIISPSMIDFAFWDDFIRQGVISGHLDIHLSKAQKIDKNSLFGEITFEQAAINYDEEFPQVRDIKAKAIVEGKKLSCQILGGKSNDVNISSGTVDFEWIDAVASVVKIDLNIDGKSSSIKDFIGVEQKNKLKQQSIDFSKTDGIFGLNVKIDVPLDPEKKNVVNISGILDNFKMSAFDKALNLNNASLKILINNDLILAQGPGVLNGYPLKINYTQDMPYTKSTLEADVVLQDKSGRFKHFVAFDGGTNLNVIYQESKKNYSINAKADLTKIGIFSDKLNISKAKGVKCSFEANKSAKDPNLAFSIVSKENLNLHGIFIPENQKLKITKLLTDKINLSGSIKIDGDRIKTNIEGNYLDLSNYDFFNLLKKERSEFGLDLDVQFAKVLLKNEQSINNLNIQIKCDKEKCFEGVARADAPNDLITLSLDSSGSFETWQIRSRDAGSFLKGLGLYKKIKHGSMILNASTERRAVKTGEVLPIMKGNLLIKDFSAIKNPVISKIVSITSVPGIIDVLTNNKEIKFNSLFAEFNFYNDVISLSAVDIIGPSFDLNSKGSIDVNNREIRLKGSVVPSIYYLNSMLKMTPILGSLFSGKKRGVIAVPFSVREKY